MMEFNDRAAQPVHVHYAMLMMFVPYPQDVLDARKATPDDVFAISHRFAKTLYTKEVASQFAVKAADLNMEMLEADIDEVDDIDWDEIGVTLTRHVGMKPIKLQVAADGHRIILGCTGYEGTTDAKEP